MKTDGNDLLKERDIRDAACDRIDIGEIERTEPQDIVQRAGELEWVGSSVQDTLNRLIIGASPGDRVDGVAALEIEHGDDLEGTVRHGTGRCARGPGS